MWPSSLRPHAAFPRHRLWASSFCSLALADSNDLSTSAISSADLRTFDYRPIVFSVQLERAALDILWPHSHLMDLVREATVLAWRSVSIFHKPSGISRRSSAAQSNFGQVRLNRYRTAPVFFWSLQTISTVCTHVDAVAWFTLCTAVAQACASVHLPLESSFDMLDIKLKLSWCWPEFAIVFLFPSCSESCSLRERAVRIQARARRAERQAQCQGSGNLPVHRRHFPKQEGVLARSDQGVTLEGFARSSVERIIPPHPPLIGLLSKGWSVLGKLQQSSRTDDFVRAPRHLWGTVLLQLARVASTRVVPGISSVHRGQLPAQPGSSHHSGSATDKVFILTGRFMPCVLLFPI